MKLKLISTLGLAFAGISGSASGAVTVLTVDAGGEGTYFEVSGSDIRVNIDVVRVGASNNGALDFIGLLAFDISGFTTAELNAATSITLGFNLAAQDNSPALDQLAIDYVGTFASNDLGANGVNGASANATTIVTSSSINSVFSGAETVGTGKTYDATAISSDAFANQYAFFLVTDPNGGGHQWDVPAGSATLAIDTIPEPTSALLLGLGGLAFFARLRR